MQLEVGEILEGKVTGILKFGAFVDLGEGKSGMVHISEIANTYVNDIHEHVSEGQTVRVRVINIADDGKISLSIKKALPETARPQKQQFSRPRSEAAVKDKDADQPRPRHSSVRKPVKKEQPSIEDIEYIEYAYEPKTTVTDAGFEDMLSRFKMSSEDRMSGLKNMDVRKRGRRK